MAEEHHDSAAENEQHDEQSASLTRVAQLFQDYAQRWGEQIQCIFELAATEAKISAKALLLTLGLIVAIAMTALVIWLTVVGAAATVLYWLTQSMALSICGSLAAQLLLLWWLIRQMKLALAQVSFERTIAVSKKPSSSQEKTDADPSDPEKTD